MRVEEVPGPAPTALVANLPYNVSVPVLIHLLTLLPSLERGLVMVQAEVADRLAAGPGSKTYGVPSVKAAWFADVRRAGAIGRNVFWPAPNVDSGLVAWTRTDPPETTATRQQVFAVVDAAFAQRRKQVRAALRGLAGSAEAATAALESAGVDPTARGEVLTVARLRPDRRGAQRGDRMSITVRAAAKINLHLGVGRVRDDGFHPLDTVYQAIGIHDDLTLASRRRPQLATQRRRPHRPGRPCPTATTTSCCAPRAAGARTPDVRPPADFEVLKDIPVAGGMAGGSADAAAALVAVDRLHGPADLRRRPARPGRPSSAATSPSRLVGGTARGVGRGEVVTPVDDRRLRGGGWPCRPPRASRRRSSTATSTPCDPTRPRCPPPAEPLLAALATGSPSALARALHNDLQEPAIDLRPELGDLIALGEAEGALRGIVSGSGPTVVFLCESADGARETGAGLAGAGHDVVLTATGPGRGRPRRHPEGPPSRATGSGPGGMNRRGRGSMRLCCARDIRAARVTGGGS